MENYSTKDIKKRQMYFDEGTAQSSSGSQDFVFDDNHIIQVRYLVDGTKRLYFKLGEVSDKEIFFGDQTASYITLTDTNPCSYWITPLSSTTFVFTWYDNGSIWSRVGSLDTTAMTITSVSSWGAVTELDLGAGYIIKAYGTEYNLVTDISSTALGQFTVAYIKLRSADNNYWNECCVGTVVGTDITFGSVNSLANGTGELRHIHLQCLSSTAFIITYTRSAGGEFNKVYVVAYTNSFDTITRVDFHEVEVPGAENAENKSLIKLDSNNFAISYNAPLVNHIKICSFYSGTLATSADSVTNVGDNNHICVIKDSYFIWLYHSTVDSKIYAEFCTADLYNMTTVQNTLTLTELTTDVDDDVSLPGRLFKMNTTGSLNIPYSVIIDNANQEYIIRLLST
jgi:hypothetical protein